MEECASKPEQYFVLFHELDLLNRGVLANRLQHESIDEESVNCNRLQNFVDSLSQTEVTDDTIQVFLFIRIAQRTETLCTDSNLMFQYQIESNGRATHLVEKVTYGAELFCSITKALDGQNETKKETTNTICRVAKDFIETTTEWDLPSIKVPVELDKVEIKFEIFSDSQSKEQKNSFEELQDWLRNIVSNSDNWRPIRVNLRQIKDQLETRLWLEKKAYMAFVKKEWETKMENDSEFSHLKKNLSHHMEPLWDKILDLNDISFSDKYTPKNALSAMKPAINILEDFSKLLISGNSDVDEVQSFINRIQELVIQKDYVTQPSTSNLLVNAHQTQLQQKETSDISEKEEKSYSPRTLKRPVSIDVASLLLNNCDEMEIEELLKRTENKLDTNANTSVEDSDSSESQQEYSNERIGEKLRGENYSELVEPNVYMLKAKEHSTSTDLIRWFEIGRPNTKSKRDHKIIILMGATGSGKSTLINGMVNYILGVKWEDPFRFKCVREDESASQNQALSQTSSVTAYTIHHRQGMSVPYSITIIDTPGYGDTRGVKRDKEITQLIHRFLTEKDVAIDHIHAACFVAASGDSRLTVTQRYILDSVLSTFGKDFKDNIRLLVTFADNADPPVVEACLAAHFPVTSAGISYSKFNSSVLYASNEQTEDDDEEDYGFDELFWDMGQENFAKFFTMLEGIEGKDLKSTRDVIQHRLILEQSLKEIERELEVCFIKIENMDNFISKIAQYGHDMERNKNLVVEKTEMKATFNCRRCKKIRKETTHLKSRRESHEEETICKCLPKNPHTNFAVHNIPVKVETTLGKMKSEFELNYKGKLKTEELLAKCFEELNQTKANVIHLFEQVGVAGRSLDSTALRSNALTPADYLSLMRSRVAEEQAPGYLTRLETLAELQRRFSVTEPLSFPTATTISSGERPHISRTGLLLANCGSELLERCVIMLLTYAPICDQALRAIAGSELCDVFYEKIEWLWNFGQLCWRILLLLVRGIHNSDRNNTEESTNMERWVNSKEEDNEFYAYSMCRVD